MITLDEYVHAMPADQKSIFYAAGESYERLAKMPVVQFVLSKGYDVLFCTEDVDEFCFQAMMGYKASDAEADDEMFEFKNVAGGDLGLESEEEKAAADEASKEHEDLFGAMKDVLGDKVIKVAVSSRLQDAPACITAEGPMSLEMERILSQLPEGEDIKSDRVLELNIEHPIFGVLKAAYDAQDTQKVELYTNVLYDQALLIEGFPVDDPVAFAQNICSLMM